MIFTLCYSKPPLVNLKKFQLFSLNFYKRFSVFVLCTASGSGGGGGAPALALGGEGESDDSEVGRLQGM